MRWWLLGTGDRPTRWWPQRCSQARVLEGDERPERLWGVTRSLPQRSLLTTTTALCGLVVLGGHAMAAGSGGEAVTTHTVRLAMDEAGDVELRDLLRLLLHELGSHVDVPEDTIEGTIPVGGLKGRLAIAGLHEIVGPMGLGLELTDDALVLHINDAKLGRHIDALEMALRALFGVEGPAVSLEQISDAQSRGPPLLLLHGLDATSESLRPAAQALAAQGYDTYLFTYPNDGRVMASARALGVELRALSQSTGQRLSLVTVSMGGLVALAALELDETYDGSVARLIACTPPFEGSPLAPYHLVTEVVDTVRGLLEGDTSGLLIFDGLGQASSDLRPGSSFLRQIKASKRRQDVQYTILAGRGEIVPDLQLKRLLTALAHARPTTRGATRLGLDLVAEATRAARQSSGGRGDGAVPLSSQHLEGVKDRVILPLHHLEFLHPQGEGGPLAAMETVLERLPRVSSPEGSP